MNSFRAVERALIYEAQRQYEVWQETGQQLGEVPKQTRGWDDQAQITRGQRHKEESSDYRYFPDPDLVPVKISPEEVASMRSEIGELPAAIRQRLVEDHEITPYTSDVLVKQGRGVVDYFVAVAQASGDGKTAGNWVQQEVLRTLKEKELDIEAFPVASHELAELLAIIQRGELDNSRGKEVFTEMVAAGKSAVQVMQEKGIESVDETQVIELCRSLLEKNPQVVADVQGGKQQAIGSLIGQAKQQNPNINPGNVRQIMLDLIQKMD
jgi:aspartyl-tRNA(Asn)/glutamyl-tRNA(Gln) amidotransferase subunit B